MKHIITALVIMSLLVLNLTFVFATQESVDAAQNVIIKLVDSMDKQDWDTFLALSTGHDPAEFMEFINDEENINEANGILTVQSAKVKEIMSIPVNEYKKFATHDLTPYLTVECFLVGIDFEVKKESQFYYNGVNYYITYVGKIYDTWKIIQHSSAPLDLLNKDGYSFNSEDEKAAIKIIKARYKGEIINKDGKILSTNKPDHSEMKNTSTEKISSQFLMTTTDEHTPPATIKVYHARSSSDPYYHQVTTPDFTEYVKDVLPNEWGYNDDWKPEALEAGSIVVKMFGWWHYYNPEWPAITYNAHVIDDERYQVYILNSRQTKTSAAVDETWYAEMRNSVGHIFVAQYLPGNYDSYGENGGVMYQNGTRFLADFWVDFYWWDMCDHYYSYSDKSSGSIYFVNFIQTDSW